jgi:DNA-binding NarL/FixJ family response regulator
MTVIRHLRSTAPEVLKRVLVVTGSSQSVISTFRDEVAGVVRKPFETPELLTAIRNVTQGQ